MSAIPEFKTGIDTSLKIKQSGVWYIIKGLNKAKLPSIELTPLEVEEFGRRFSFTLPAGGKYGEMSFGGNVVLNDTTGQDIIRNYIRNATLLTTDFRFYLDLTNFMTCDLAQDVSSGFYFMKFDYGETDKNGLYSLTGSMATRGDVVYMFNHASSAYGDLAFVVATTPGTDSATITDSSAQFVIDGFVAGQTIEVEGSTSNDGQYTILSVVAGTITLIVADVLTSEVAIAATKIHGGTN